jgi:hypothetical protein
VQALVEAGGPDEAPEISRPIAFPQLLCCCRRRFLVRLPRGHKEASSTVWAFLVQVDYFRFARESAGIRKFRLFGAPEALGD